VRALDSSPVSVSRRVHPGFRHPPLLIHGWALGNSTGPVPMIHPCMKICLDLTPFVRKTSLGPVIPCMESGQRSELTGTATADKVKPW